MSINAYWDLLNGLLIRSGYKRTDYASANHYYLAGATVADACAKITLALTIKLTLTRGTEMPLIWIYSEAGQARTFANIASVRGYHVKWTESWE